MSGMTQISDQNCPICPDRICFLPEEGDAFISKTAELTKCWTTKAEWRRLERAFPPIFLRMRTDRTDRTSALAIWQLYYRHHLSNMTGNSIIMSNRSDFIKGQFSSNTFQEFTSATKSSILPRAHRIRVIWYDSYLKPRSDPTPTRNLKLAQKCLGNLNQKLRNKENSIDQIIFIGPIIRRLFPI